jgi:1-acyl-sn-glycerol-3-phosphate acyltransferase
MPNALLAGRYPKGVVKSGWLYLIMRQLFRVTVSLIWRVRVFDRHHEPADGPAVYICNHQSFLDPILMSFGLIRPMNYMARDSLFTVPLMGRVFRALNAFAVRRGSADLGAIKEAMRRLKEGGQVVVFAEGTRTTDGAIAPLLPGVAVLAQRCAKWTVPVVIDGAFECWPRTQALPSPGSIVVRYCEPISQAQARAMAPDELMDLVRRRMIEMQADMRRRVGRAPIRYPDLKATSTSPEASG